MTSVQIIYLAIVGAYMAGMLYLGYRMSRSVDTLESFYTSDRNMNAAVTGFSFSATQMSSGAVMGNPAVTYNLGYNYIPNNFSASAAPWFTFISVGERVRKISERVGAVDYGDIFGVRYGGAAKLIYAMVILVFYIPLIVAQFKAAGDIGHVLLGIPYWLGVTAVGIIILLYTLWGGMFAVAWTDLVQGMIMIVGIGTLAVLCLLKTGGFTAMNEALAAISPDMVRTTGKVTVTWAVCNLISWSCLMIGGSAAAMVRFLLPKDVKTLRRAFGYSAVFQTIIFASLAIIGAAGPILFPGLERTDQVVPSLINQMLHPVFGGIVVAGILAAMMSTVDSVLLLCSSCLTKNIYLTHFRPNASVEEQLKVGRRTIVIVGLISLAMAFRPFTAIQWLVLFSFNVFTSCFTVPILFAVWWPRATRAGGTLGMLAGGASSLYWYYLGYVQFNSFAQWPYGIWPGVLGTLVCLVVTVAVSLMTAPVEERVLDLFYQE